MAANDYLAYDCRFLTRVVATMRMFNYKVFERDDLPYNLNIIAIRSKDPVVNRFNDLMVVFWFYQGQVYKHLMEITTLPGRYFLIDKLLNPRGAAILKPGQYTKAYRLGAHKGQYTALVQAKSLPVYRDGNRDTVYDYAPATIDNGYHGINIHRAAKCTKVPKVGRNSAGCIVVQDPCKYGQFITLCERSSEVFGNSFTLTLIEETDLKTV